MSAIVTIVPCATGEPPGVRVGVTVSARRDGPFGDQVLLASGPSGPHVIVTEGRSPVSSVPAAGTIAP